MADEKAPVAEVKKDEVDPAIKFLRIEFEKLQAKVNALAAKLADHGIFVK